MKILALFLLVLNIVTMVTVVKFTNDHREVITIYTLNDIYYLEGNVITSESGSYNFEFSSRSTAILALEDITATDALEVNSVPAVYY
jgi:hypothetical protein